jgi:hypothetical protein
LSGGGDIRLQSALLEGRGIGLHTSQLQNRKVSNFSGGIRFQQKYQISTKISEYGKNIRLHATAILLRQHFRRHFASITSSLFSEFVQICANFCNINILSAMLPDLTGNVNILALSNRQPR